MNRGGATIRELIGKRAAFFYRRIMDAKFDLLNGVDTSGYISNTELGLDDSSHDYQASPEHHILSAIRSLPIDHREFTFVDLGCGKGRVLVVARRFPFREIVGVEISQPLCQIAAKNTRLFENVSVVAGDAATYSIPAGPTVIYLGNPFEARVLEIVMTNIEQRRKQSPAPLYVVYLVPEFRDVLDRKAFLKPLPSPRLISIYAVQ